MRTEVVIYKGWATFTEDKINISSAGKWQCPIVKSFNCHLKCPNRSLFCEASSLDELRVIVEERVDYWNTRRRHTTLQNRIPIEYIEERLEDED
ncbi:integrase core domain-containing protein [Candidatus Bipolaricaulota bacterium]|nr:integrase core domain-containing protein [Candidatus Bipolaricaulota bacterium]